MIKIGVDAMGGDYAPKEQVLGSMLAIKKIDDIEINLYGDKDLILPYLTDSTRINIIDAKYAIPMGEKNPIQAIKTHKDSSMVVALSSLRTDESDAVVSSGATQALIAGAHLLVRRMKGFKRTAIAPLLPRVDGQHTILLDAGANLSIKPEYMLQQAYFAKIYAQKILKIEDPKVGLINIGAEDGKGREFDQEVFKLFKDTDLFTFYGNVEPKVVFDPPVDILISDGFTANIVMKTAEGAAKGMGKMLKKHLTSTFFGKIGALLARKNLNEFKRVVSAEEIGGAIIYGLYKPVIKAQGASKAYGFYNGIRQAANVVREKVFESVKEYIDSTKELEDE
ncbi:MAG: phosphate acyltransferase PlsX [Candidatus Izemoplasmatales bacterium]|jgi:glycerol-3-phosphate acyltransferase PlsX|nr:phosphate acyltransferase PlsX [Candidatus Izemoplasmatales bacterium]